MRRSPLFLLLLVPLLGAPADGAPKRLPAPCKVEYPSDARVEWECRRLKGRETLESLFGERWRDVARFNRIDRRHAYPGVPIKAPKRLDDIRDFTPLPSLYPEAQGEEKFILVDLTEQFLGAYEHGRLRFSFPIASGSRKNRTPTGSFRISAHSRNHRSSLYFIEQTSIPYPMHYGLRFLVSRRGIAFWIHGRDVPGFPASHGCIGLYDEEMQRRYYKSPKEAELEDAKVLYEWVLGDRPDDGGMRLLKDGPKVVITGEPPP